MLRFQRRRVLSAEETAANAAKREARKQAALTCQCCGGSFLANLGTIAHHGYQRPGYGWQTASCMGAKHVPFEVDRARLLAMINAIKAHRDVLLGALKEIEDETQPITHRWKVRVVGADGKLIREGYSFKEEEKTFDVTAATWEEFKALRLNSVYTYDWASYKNSEVESRKAAIKNLREQIAFEQARYDGWKQTHHRVDGQWVKL